MAISGTILLPLQCSEVVFQLFLFGFFVHHVRVPRKLQSIRRCKVWTILLQVLLVYLDHADQQSQDYPLLSDHRLLYLTYN